MCCVRLRVNRSLGVIVFILCAGYPPFYGETDAEIFKAIRRGVFTFPMAPPSSSSSSSSSSSAQAQHLLSPAARDFLSRLLVRDWKKRISVTQALAHPWVADAKREASDQYVWSPASRFYVYSRVLLCVLCTVC